MSPLNDDQARPQLDHLEPGERIVEIPCGIFTRTIGQMAHAVRVAKVGEILAVRTNDA